MPSKQAKANANANSQRVSTHMSNLNDFIGALDTYEPTIPDAVAKFYMQKSGVEASDHRMVKLIALATDHFLARTIHEARQLSLLRTQHGIEPTKEIQKPKSENNKKTKGNKRKIADVEKEEAEADRDDDNADINTMDSMFLLEDLRKALADQGVNIPAEPIRH
jgi:hypothetical protein